MTPPTPTLLGLKMPLLRLFANILRWILCPLKQRTTSLTGRSCHGVLRRIPLRPLGFKHVPLWTLIISIQFVLQFTYLIHSCLSRTVPLTFLLYYQRSDANLTWRPWGTLKLWTLGSTSSHPLPLTAWLLVMEVSMREPSTALPSTSCFRQGTSLLDIYLYFAVLRRVSGLIFAQRWRRT